MLEISLHFQNPTRARLCSARAPFDLWFLGQHPKTATGEKSCLHYTIFYGVVLVAACVELGESVLVAAAPSPTMTVRVAVPVLPAWSAAVKTIYIVRAAHRGIEREG